MRLYLDEDSTSRHLVNAMRRAGHDLQVPRDVGLRGHDDAVQLLQAIREQRVMLTGNHRDYEHLHNLILGSGGLHPGILTIRKDDDRRRDMTPSHVVKAMANLQSTGIAMLSEFVVPNHWR